MRNPDDRNRGRIRAWLLRLATMTLLPAIFLVLLETGLRLAGFGHPVEFLLRIPGRDAFTGNARFGWRFFSRAQSRTPVMMDLPAVKSNDTRRIFLLGSSAALGMPEPAYGVARILEAMLRESFTNLDFEVVNAAMTAINSHVMLPIARDCARHSPDLFIIYEGNNEVVGPFGPGTVFQDFSPSLDGIRARVWMRSMRTGQLMQQVAARVGSAMRPDTGWRGMSMFLEHRIDGDDPRLESVRHFFRANLQDVFSVAGAAGIPVVVSTVAVNLRDCPPFASSQRKGLSAEAASDWDDAFRAADGLYAAGNFAGALEKFQALAKKDEGHAGVQFRMAGCAYALGRYDDAKTHFIRSMDLDALRFRTDTRLNQVIREIAGGREAEGIHLVDSARHFEEASARHHGIPGGEFFHDHVHFNFTGNYELARALFKTVAPLVVKAEAAAFIAPPSQARCAQLLALTGPDDYAMQATINQLMAHPPFSHQYDYATQRASSALRLYELRKEMTLPAKQLALAAHREALARRPHDVLQRNRVAQLLNECGEFQAAAEEWKRLQSLLPGEAAFHLERGRSLLVTGDETGAGEEFERAMGGTFYPAEISDLIGEMFLKFGRFDDAIHWYRRGLDAVPNHADLRNGLGCVLMQQRQYDRALAELERAVQYSPGNARYRDNLGMTLFFLGRTAGALAELRRAVQCDPADASARNHLGYVLVRLGRDAEGGEQFAIGLRMHPDHADLRNHYDEFLRHNPPPR